MCPLQTWSDGGHRHKGTSSAAALVKAWRADRREPVLLAALARWLPADECDSMLAEVEGLALAAKLLMEVVIRWKLTTEAMRNILQDPAASEICLSLE